MFILIPVIFIGAVGALLGAMFGVGGGIIMVPAFYKLGLSIQQAIATSLAVIVVTSVTASIRYGREGWIRWDFAAAAAVGAVVAAIVGTELVKKFSGAQIKMGFGVFLIALGVLMLFTSRTGNA